MDRIEAIKALNRFQVNYTGMTIDETNRVDEALAMAARALRPVSRERVEKVWRGEGERITDPYGRIGGFLCKCGKQTYSASNFCPNCGAAQTDEAVEMVMERLEAMKDAD